MRDHFKTINVLADCQLERWIEPRQNHYSIEGKTQEAYSGLSSYMEMGETDTRVGKAPVRTRGYSALQFQGNPKNFAETDSMGLAVSSETALYVRFGEILSLVNLNAEAFGGRIAWFVFDTGLTPAPPSRIKEITRDESEKIEIIVKSVFQAIRNDFSSYYKNQRLLDWMETPLSEIYRDELKKMSGKVSNPFVRDFIRGHAQLSYRHVRGMAFKLSCVDHAIQIMKGSTSITELIQTAEEYVLIIEVQNVSSFGNLVETSQKESSSFAIQKDQFGRMAYHYKLFLQALNDVWDKSDQKGIFPLESLRGNFPSIKPNQSFPEILRRFITNRGRTRELLAPFGVGLQEVDGVDCMIIFDSKRFRALWEGQKETIEEEKTV